jgi:hypothetical protein
MSGRKCIVYTFPFVKLSLVLTKAGPFPGLTWRNSIILYISLLYLIHNPFLMSDVDAILFAFL